MDYYAQYLKSIGGTSARAAILVQRVFNDAMEDAEEIPPEFMELYLKQGSAIMYWAATGETIVNMPLPEEFTIRENVREIGAGPLRVERLAIE